MVYLLLVVLGLSLGIIGYFLGARGTKSIALKAAMVNHGPHQECHYCHHLVARYAMDEHNYPICANCLSEIK